jgi:large subunit ribosomal protein L30
MRIAAVLIRGPHDIRADIRETLYLLRLRKKHACGVYERSPVIMGMLRKVKDYVTYGEISDATYSELVKKRKPKDEKHPVFHLHPPRGGYGRKGIKVSFQEKGALGYRKDKINDLLVRML